MKAILQRVTRAEVRIDGQAVGKISRGFVVLLGVAGGDTEDGQHRAATLGDDRRGQEEPEDKAEVVRRVVDAEHPSPVVVGALLLDVGIHDDLRTLGENRPRRDRAASSRRPEPRGISRATVLRCFRVPAGLPWSHKRRCG